MRSVIIGLSFSLLAGCATVSMVSGEASVETGLTQTQSQLRLASSEYCDNTVSEGWVNASGGIFGLANVLINGKSDAPAQDYASRVEAGTAAPALVLARIMTDSEAARAGLKTVMAEATAVLTSQTNTKTSRADVMSFERALVRAQMSHSSFLAALNEVSVRADIDAQPVRNELGKFSVTIEDAQSLADGLSDKYASLNSSVS